MMIGAVVLPFYILAIVTSVLFIVWSLFKRKIKTFSFVLAVVIVCAFTVTEIEQEIERRALQTILLADDDGWLSGQVQSNIFLLGLFLFLVFVVINLPKLLRRKK